MDQTVLDAQIRWPDVPAAYGWLSLTARGEWRLHPVGDAQQGGAGVGISNQQILTFIGRNYAAEPAGAWFFQNGPQRVYVRLDASPFIARVDPALGTLITHNGLTITTVDQWLLDETGQLYAQTDLGAARIDDRDLSILAELLFTADSQGLLSVLEQYELDQLPGKGFSFFDPTQRFLALRQPALLHAVKQKDVPLTLNFITNPAPAVT